MSLRCSQCSTGHLEEAVVPQADVSDLVGLSSVQVRGAPVLRCGCCGALSWEGPVLEAIEREVARQLVSDSSFLDPDGVRYLRKYLGLTQAALATRLGVDRTTIARWETADRPLRHGEALGLRALVALHLVAERPALASSLQKRFATPPPAERSEVHIVPSEVFEVAL